VEKGKGVQKDQLDFAFLFVVDVLKKCSVLLVCGGREYALASKAFEGCPFTHAAPGPTLPLSPLSPITLLHPHFLFTVSPDHSTKTDQPWSAEHSTNITGEQTLCDVGPLVSRKSQFLPAFTRVLQSGFTCHKERTSSASYVPGEEGASERASEED
jgi:hypothetical protein